MNAPTLRGRRLGTVLRQRREQAGLTLDQAAESAGVSRSALSRAENGLVPVQPPVVRTLLQLYECPSAEVDSYVQVAKDAKRRGWWIKYRDVLSTQYADYIGLEFDAVSLRAFEPSLVHGLLQTEDYARAVIKDGHREITCDEIERRAEVRMARQERLLKDPPLRLWIILDEAVIRRPIGGLSVMKNQLDRLLDVAEMPRITIQVVPFDAGGHPGTLGSFTIMEFPQNGDDVVYVETYGGDLYLEEPAELQALTLAFDHLRAIALSAEKSIDLIRQASMELSRKEARA